MNENLLKSIVVILGVLIVIALGVLVYGIATKAPKHIGALEDESTPSPYEVNINIPQHYLVDTTATETHLILHFLNDSQNVILHIYDLQDGSFQGQFSWQGESK